MNPRLGLLLFFEGDFRRVSATIKNVVSFSAVSAVLKNGDNDVTSLYIDTSPTSTGNVLITDVIGGKAVMVPGSYRYFISGTYGGKKRTWYWDVLVLPKDLSLLSGFEIPLDDYNPLAESISIYEGNSFGKEIIIPGVVFTAVSAVLKSFSDDITATYAGGSASASGETLTTHSIGGLGTIPAGDYGYFITGTYNNGEAKSTWYYPVKVLPMQGVL